MKRRIQFTIVFISIFMFMCNPKKTEDSSSLLLFFLLSNTANTSAATTTSTVTSSAVVSTFAGLSGSSGTTDGTGSDARFRFPYSITRDAGGSFYVTDNGNYTIRKITSTGVVTTFAGTAGSSGTTDATGGAARFYDPEGISVDSSGNLYVSDNLKYTIRKITSSGVVTTFVGSLDNVGTTDGTGTAARFYSPRSIAIDSNGNLFLADSGNHNIRKITSAGVVTTYAGTTASSGSTDDSSLASKFFEPNGIAVDSNGNVYVADTSNSTIRKISSTGIVSTLAGLAGSRGTTDGAGSEARFSWPQGLTVDSSGNVFVADTYNHTIRKITSAGVVTTVAGTAGTSGTTDGVGATAKFSFPRGITLDGTGNLLIADSSNGSIRKIVF